MRSIDAGPNPRYFGTGRGITLFNYLAAIGVTGLADLDQGVLERYLAELHAELTGRHHHGVHIGQLNSFLNAVRQYLKLFYGWMAKRRAFCT